MITESIGYSIYGKTVMDRPCLVECKPDATVQGEIHMSKDADVFSASVYKTQAPTGVNKYEALGADLYTGTILGYTGLNDSIAFTFDPSKINSPTGAINGEYYGLKFIATETGIFGGKTVSDVIVKMNADLEV
jgi:hypothetical protein